MTDESSRTSTGDADLVAGRQSPSALVQNAAIFARKVVDDLAKTRPKDMRALGKLVVAGHVQFDVRVRDVLGGMHQIDLVAVTAEAERVIGGILFHAGR